MTFGAQHYVPVLKVKRAEKAALRLLTAPISGVVTPLLEIVERTKKPLDEHLDTAFDRLAESARPFARCFLDAHEIAADGPGGAAEVFGRAAAEGIAFTPVTGISRAADIDAALAHRPLGLAIRLTRVNFEAGGVGAATLRFLDRYRLTPETTDLIVDLGAVDDMISAGVETLAAAFLDEVPDHSRWRSFTVSACAFPRSMGAVERHSHLFFERADWLAWRERQYAARATLRRLPTYSDGAIQHPLGVEGFDPRLMPVSAAVRYTRGDGWLLVKGESTRITRPSEQYQSLATQLVYGALRQHYYGADHCPGCAAIKRVADGAAAGFGSPEAWRKVGTVHHITTAAQQILELPWP